MAKLPPEVRIDIAQNTTQDIREIESLLNVIHNKIEAQEIKEKIKAATSTEPKRLQNVNFKNSPTTASTFLVDSKPLPLTPTCVYCSGNHFSASCESVIDIGAQKEIMKCDK